MNSNIILGWSMVALAIAGLIVLFRLRNKSRNTKKAAPLLSFARESNSEISSYDSCDKTLIGIDNTKNRNLFFIHNIPGREIREKINLSEVSECRLFKTERKVKYNKESVNVIDRIEVIFSFYNHKPEVSFEFYNTDYDHLTISGELKLAQKWTGMIKSIVDVNQDFNNVKQKQDLFSPAIKSSTVNENTNTKEKKLKMPVKKEHAIG